MTVEILTGIQEGILEGLAVYRFLTVQLMQRAGIGKDDGHLGDLLRVMLRKGWIDRTEKVPGKPGIGRLSHLYWLQPKGAEILGELRGEAPTPTFKGMISAADELPHKLAILRSHILLREWAQANDAWVDWFQGDYAPGSRELRKLTTLPHASALPKKPKSYTADALAQVTLADGFPRLLAIEVYWGGRRRTLSHFRDMLPTLREVCELESVEKHFSAATGARFLVVFADAKMQALALRAWPDQSSPIWQQFFVKALDELEPDFAGGWHHPDGNRRSLF